MTGPRRSSPTPRRASLVATGTVLAGLLTAGVVAPAAADASPSQHRPPLAADRVVQHDIDALADEGFPGVLAAVSDGRGQGPGHGRDHVAGVGDLATGAPVPVNGSVRIASNTKTFTATVVLQLVAEREVQLDRPVETYLPGLVRGPGGDGRQITVRQLLQHTSGIPDYDDVLYPEWLASGFTRHYTGQELVAAGLGRPALAAPGAAFSYSNTNYAIAGLLVERVTGHRIGDEITHRIIEPLHLRDTYWPSDGDRGIRGPHPRNYLQETAGGPWTDVTEMDPSMGWAAGQVVSTPRDLLRFFSAVVGGELLPPAQQQEMERTVPATDISLRNAGDRYGLGLASFELSCGGRAWTHGGDLPGTHSREAVTADGRGVSIVVTGDPANADPADAHQFEHLEDAVDAAFCALP
ncbi:serine hydrolase domain-containing protein [Modestobacter sp. NPDC049651]|uniref:serine hydrolase domain-containing protein n=1 Tax=unclassified Modestobacter TaxID=2643866 RepID=UPI0033E6BA6F